MAYERINRGSRTPEEAVGYKEVMDEALHKTRDWPVYAESVGSSATSQIILIRPVWPEAKEERYTFGISDSERLPVDTPYLGEQDSDRDVDSSAVA